MRRIFEILIMAGVLLFASVSAFSATIHVPSDQPTIQAGINAAVNGDTVLVAPGTYVENINFSGKQIAVMSSAGHDVTFIESAADYIPIVSFIDTENSLAVLDGFDISGSLYAPGILCNNFSKPIIQNCAIHDCSNDSDGGGIECQGSAPKIRNNIIYDNTAEGGTSGGGIGGNILPMEKPGENSGYTLYNEAIEIRMEISNNIIFGNHAHNGPGIGLPEGHYLDIRSNLVFENVGAETYGGGIYIYYSTNSFIINNTIVGNTKGIYTPSPNIQILNNIVVSNLNAGLYAPTAMIDYNNVWNNGWYNNPGPNGISLDPLFNNPSNNDYTLQSLSPCIDAGDPNPIYNDPDGTRNDMGAWPYIGIRILSFEIENELYILRIVNHTPVFQWEYSEGFAQTQFEIEIGIDEDWEAAEMWDPDIVYSADTYITYGGNPLLDGELYYIRLRIADGDLWSYWYETPFRMNSIPSIPLPITPIGNMVTSIQQPTLQIQNSIDAQQDPIKYDFEIYFDTLSSEPFASADNITEQLGEETTGWTVDVPLTENQQFWWRARAFDAFEYSDWSGFGSFWVNATEEPPTEFSVITPPDIPGATIYNMLPQFSWGLSTDPDPYDTIKYTFELAVDEYFVYKKTIEGILLNSYTPPDTKVDSLLFGEEYWWRVKAVDRTAIAIVSLNNLHFKTWMLGDANNDRGVDILDIVFLINALYKGGDQPDPLFSGDINADCAVNILDIVYLINYKYKSGPAPKVGCN